jgi:hypothetical protein
MDKQLKSGTSHKNPVVRKLARNNESPFHKGLRAFTSGDLSNPFKKDTQDHRDWEFGFNKSYFANLERLNGKTKKTTA